MSDKYIREIEEILKQAEGPKKAKPASMLGALRAVFSLSAKHVAPVGLALLLVSFVLVNAFNYLLGDGGIDIGFLLPIWAGLALVVIVYALLFAKPSPSRPSHWEERVTEPKPSPLEKFRRWLRR